MSLFSARLSGKRTAAFDNRGWVTVFAGRHGPLRIVLAAAVISISVASAVAASIALLFDRPLLPDLQIAVLTAAVLAPAATLLLLHLVQRLDRAERQLADSLPVNESRFEMLARIAPVGIFQTDAGGLCLFVNQRYSEITGLSAAQAAAEGWAKALHPEDRERAVGEWYACLREDRPFRAEYRFQRPDGSVAWVLGQAEAKRARNGDVIGYFGTLTEITRNKENEKVLERTNRALKVVSACNAALARITDEAELLQEICRIIVETGHYRMAWVGFAENDEAKTVRPAARWGYDAGYLDEIKVSWADREDGRGPAGSAIRGRKPYVVKNAATDPAFARWRHAALARGFASLIALPLQDTSHVMGILGLYATEPNAFDEEEVGLLGGLADNLAHGINAIRTRTEHARAEEAIRESEERFRAAFEQAAVGMSYVSPEGRYLRVNQKFCDITSYSRTELLSRSFPDITHPDDAGRDVEQAQRVLSGETPTYSLEKRYIRKDGSIIWVNRTISMVRDSAGEPKYFIAVVQDITAAKKMESQLRQAQKMDAVGQLTGGIAHDFNNLLTVVLGNLELLRDNPRADDRTRELASRAIAAADRGASLTQRMLAFSRKQVLQPQITGINDLIENMHDLLRRSLGEVIRVETHLTASLPPVIVDPGQLEIALLNLAVNARDAMPRGGTLTIETREGYLDQIHSIETDDVTPGEYVLVAVSDTGTGMPPEVRDRVFEPFFTTKEVGKGTGLGLSMVYGFVRQTGGHVAISSDPGKGTTVRIYLPCASAAVHAQHQVRLPRPDTAPHGETILVVEDEPDVRVLAVAMLREMGFTVLEAATAAAALRIIDDGAPVDLLFTDVVLPGGTSGPDLVREVARRRPGTKILFTSGYSDGLGDVVPPSKTAPILLQKPFHRTELAAKVREALEG
ncbi:MAG TPA: PAS domain S-box protein [Alphaproteobacteria bacterium]|nr:PAS domain S-box protein [Alphaproteobacteria bacterium]